MTYSILRELADSWVLLALFAFFVAAVLWAFRPAGRPIYRDASLVPFRHEDSPLPDQERP